MKETDRLRTIDLAKAAGLSVQQVRNYEAWGFLPEVPRSAKGYRLYTPLHLRAMRVARTLIAGYGWQKALSAMRATHRGEEQAALAVVDSRHAELDRGRREVEETLRTLQAVSEAMEEGSETWRRERKGLRVGEAAKRVGVRVSALRFWEERGLLTPRRDEESGYRVYDEGQMLRLRVVALLRQAGYDFDAIRGVLDELAAGRPERALRGVERRREEIAAASRACAAATGAFWAYLSETTLPVPDDAESER